MNKNSDFLSEAEIAETDQYHQRFKGKSLATGDKDASIKPLMS